MSTHKRKYGSGKTVWGYAFELEGSTRTERKRVMKWGYATKREAEDAEAKARIELSEKQRIADLEESTASTVKALPKTLGELIDEFLMQHASRNLAPKTTARYREQATYLDPALLARPLAEITALDLNREWKRLQEAGGHHRRTKELRPLSAKTVRNIAGLVSSAYGRAIFWGLCSTNPARYSEPPKVQRKEAIALTVNQQALILKASGHPALPMMLELAAATGARRGELLALRWSDIRDGHVFIGRSLTQVGAKLTFKSPKSGRFRELSLPETTLAALRRHRAAQETARAQFGSNYRTDLDLVLAGPNGQPLRPDSISSAVSALMKRLKLPKGVSLHTLRHTHGSHLLASGIELPAVSARLGHSNAHTTATVYAHAVSGRDREAAKAWEQFQGRGNSKGKDAVS